MSARNRRAFIFLGVLAALALAALQIWLRNEYIALNREIDQARGTLDLVKSQAESRRGLMERYRDFESMIVSSGYSRRRYPANALDFFSVIDRAMKKHHVEHTNRSSAGGSESGGTISLQISFSGPYYGVIKALAELRENDIVMRITDITMDADQDGKVAGVMTIVTNSSKS